MFKTQKNIIEIDFEELDIVNSIIERNVFLKASKIFDEIDEHVSMSGLNCMAEFDGGHDREVVIEAMETQMLHNADITQEWVLMPEERHHELFMEYENPNICC